MPSIDPGEECVTDPNSAGGIWQRNGHLPDPPAEEGRQVQEGGRNDGDDHDHDDAQQLGSGATHILPTYER